MFPDDSKHLRTMLWRLKGDGLNSRSAKNVVTKSDKKLPLPIGISDYRKASEEYYYVDKTLLIRDFIDERPLVSLFTRPRRFGKTLNMDMLRVYFERTEEDTSVYFRDKKIWACAFLNLSRMLHIHYGVAPIIIVAEYDTPIRQGHVRGYYDKVIDFMRTLFSGGLKDNPHLSYGFLTGILRVAKESLLLRILIRE